LASVIIRTRNITDIRSVPDSLTSSIMNERHTVHIVGGNSRCRAEQAHLIYSLGLHSEIYANVAELMERPPQSGIVLAYDDPEGESAAHVLKALSDEGYWIPVIATSQEPRPTHVVEAIKAGVLDYMKLPLRGERVTQAISRTLTDADNHVMARRRIAEARDRIANLSPRERQVLDWLTEGCSNKVIARELHISPRTVEIHRANMMTKLDADHLAKAVKLFFEARLGDDPTPEIGANAA